VSAGDPQIITPHTRLHRPRPFSQSSFRYPLERAQGQLSVRVGGLAPQDLLFPRRAPSHTHSLANHEILAPQTSSKSPPQPICLTLYIPTSPTARVAKAPSRRFAMVRLWSPYEKVAASDMRMQACE
jgi:hypothetical protein